MNSNKNAANRISKILYDIIASKIIKQITNSETGTMAFDILIDELQKEMGASFEGDLNWHVLQVKLDLQERQIIEVFFDNRKQMIGVVNRNSHSKTM